MVSSAVSMKIDSAFGTFCSKGQLPKQCQRYSEVLWSSNGLIQTQLFELAVGSIGSCMRRELIIARFLSAFVLRSQIDIGSSPEWLGTGRTLHSQHSVACQGLSTGCYWQVVHDHHDLCCLLKVVQVQVVWSYPLLLQKLHIMDVSARSNRKSPRMPMHSLGGGRSEWMTWSKTGRGESALPWQLNLSRLSGPLFESHAWLAGHSLMQFGDQIISAWMALQLGVLVSVDDLKLWPCKDDSIKRTDEGSQIRMGCDASAHLKPLWVTHHRKLICLLLKSSQEWCPPADLMTMELPSL